MKEVYIVGTGKFLPGEAVDNSSITDRLGIVAAELDAIKRAVLRQNGIKQRYYAIDKHGNFTHSNTEMCGRAMLSACVSANRPLESVQFLSAGSTMPDILVPSFASMVHGWLGGHGIRSLHVHPVHGVCCTATHAIEAATAFLQAGRYQNALIGTSERPSVMLRAERYRLEYPRRDENVKNQDGYQYFDAEFLRYMLSDGGGALYLTNQPTPNEYSLHIDWIETISYANLLPTCMFMGDVDPDSYRPNGTWASQSYEVAAQNGSLALRQKTDLLRKHSVKQGLRFFQHLIDRELLNFDDITLIAAHISSRFFVEEIRRQMLEPGETQIPLEKFYTNLERVGNMGCASPMILLHDVFSQRMLKRGEKGLLLCPESGRFTFSVCQFTAV